MRRQGGRIVAICVWIAVAGLLAVGNLGGTGVAEAEVRVRPGVYETKRDALFVKLVVQHHRIVRLRIRALERCEDGNEGLGPERNIIGGPGLPISHNGTFRLEEAGSDAEGGGRWAEILVGRFARNGAIGTWRAWRESSEETGPGIGKYHYRCGTREPVGRAVHFVAHRR